MLSRIRDWLPSWGGVMTVLLGMLSLTGLYHISQHNYLFFHCLTETFTIVITFSVFALFWNTSQFRDNSFFLVIGIGCLFAGLLDLIHVLTYQRMSIFPGIDQSVSIHAKSASQWSGGLACMIAFLFIRRRISRNLMLLVYSGFLAFTVGCIVFWHAVPTNLVKAEGTTPFGKVGWVISGTVFLVVIGLVARKRQEFDPKVFGIIVASLIAIVVETLAFAASDAETGFANVFAHLAQVVALYLVYKAFIEVGLTKPYDLLFDSLKQNEEALQHQRQFLEAILDNSHAGIVACDAQGVLTLFNRATREFHGLPQEQIPTDQWAEHYDLYYSDGKTRMRTEDVPLFRALHEGPIHDVEMMIIPKAAPPRTLLASGGPIIDRDGQKQGAVVAMLDITDRKQTDLMLRKKEEELRQAQKMEAVGLLAGGIAHEFSNLLQAISGFANFAIEGLATTEGRYNDLKEVLKATQRAKTLTRQLLGFSRRRVLQPDNINPNQVVVDLVAMVRPIIGEHIVLETALDDSVGTVYADAGELQQSLLNLCLNARDAMPSGGKLLLATGNVVLHQPSWAHEFRVKPGRYVVFSVTDTGCGMIPEVQRHIFEPFFTTKEVGKGTGLGLAMVYGIVQQHKGAIQVCSEPGRGTAFNLYLPCGDEDARPNCTAEIELLPCGTETILLAEDEPLVRGLATLTLEKGGYTVLAAADGEEALRVYRENAAAISLMILDVVMPNLNGYETYSLVKEAYPDAKVVFCSGYDLESASAEFVLPDGVRLIAKPFDADTLLRTVREVLDGVTPQDRRESADLAYAE